MTSLEIIIDASKIKFCPGPCKSKEVEPEPTILSNGTKMFYFKPKINGGTYEICYPLGGDNEILILENVRICSSCNKRYLELWDDNDYESLVKDAESIKKKLGI